MRKILIYLLLICGFCSGTVAQNRNDEIKDTLSPVSSKETSVTVDKVDKRKKDTWLNRLLYGHIDRTYEKKMDFSFVAAPSYTREASFGIGGAASGLYRLDRTDSIMQPSDISINGNMSVEGMYVINIRGNNNFKGNKSRLSYQVSFCNQPLYLWGISYDDCVLNPAVKYTRQRVGLDVDYVYKLTDDIHIGTSLSVNHSKAHKLENISYLNGQKQSYFFVGTGLSIQYDTRDFILTPTRGIYLMLKEMVYPQVFGNYHKTLLSTIFIADAYQKLWKGAVIAADFYGRINDNSSPWALREELGGSFRMRGYYSGRYTDNSQVSAQIELRQRLYKRLGCVGWIGAGTVFPSLKKMKMRNVLPNYGLGIRFEFKHNVNVRLDYGFGKDTKGFVLNLAEAF